MKYRPTRRLAAPAALKVFEQWFGKTATVTQHASD